MALLQQITILPGISYLLISIGIIYMDLIKCLCIIMPVCILAMTISYLITKNLLGNFIRK